MFRIRSYYSRWQLQMLFQVNNVYDRLRKYLKYEVSYDWEPIEPCVQSNFDQLETKKNVGKFLQLTLKKPAQK